MGASQSQSTSECTANSGFKPRYINDWKNLSDKVQNVYVCQRKQIGLHTHTDSLFFTDNYLFGISFREDVHRFDFGKILNQNEFSRIYEYCNEIKISRDLYMWDVLKIAAKVGEEPYEIQSNNCNDSTKKLMKQLLKPT